MNQRVFIDVHDSHCCLIHGCKYGDDECPVVNKIEGYEGIPCESCQWEQEELNSFQKNQGRQLHELVKVLNYRKKMAEKTNTLEDYKSVAIVAQQIVDEMLAIRLINKV